MMGASTDATPKEADLNAEVSEFIAPIKAANARLREIRLKQLAANGEEVIVNPEPQPQDGAP